MRMGLCMCVIFTEKIVLFSSHFNYYSTLIYCPVTILLYTVTTCAPNGTFIRHLNLQPSSVQLQIPIGLCFDSSGYLFVADYEAGMYVFKLSGEHVASLGLASSGVMQHPAGIAIDEDGFVYVCDFHYEKNRVVVF